MLIGINPLLSPDLLHTLASMGHGDRIAIVDANFPGTSMNELVHHVPGVDAAAMLDAVLSLLPLDGFVEHPAVTMEVVGDPDAVPPAVRDLTAVLGRHGAAAAATLERFAFYEAAKTSFAIIQTGEQRVYGNIILAKGVIAQFDAVSDPDGDRY